MLRSHDTDELARQVVPHLPRLAPRQPLLEHMLPLQPLIPKTEDSRSCLHEWSESIEKARDFTNEISEEDFVRGMRAAGRLTKMYVSSAYHMRLCTNNVD